MGCAVAEHSPLGDYDWPMSDTGFSPYCGCFELYGFPPVERGVPTLHGDLPDVSSRAWVRVIERIEAAAARHVEIFEPLEGLSDSERSEITTLPPEIARLTSVRVLKISCSGLSWLPPAIASMRSLEILDVYQSYRLHYLPFEIARCASLRESRVSTRALFGNYKCHAPFPDLLDPVNRAAIEAVTPKSCSICSVPIGSGSEHPRWITRRIGTDIVPLLLVVCSVACIEELSRQTPGASAHTGGAGSASWGPRERLRSSVLPNSGLQQAPSSRLLGRRS